MTGEATIRQDIDGEGIASGNQNTRVLKNNLARQPKNQVCDFVVRTDLPKCHAVCTGTMRIRGDPFKTTIHLWSHMSKNFIIRHHISVDPAQKCGHPPILLLHVGLPVNLEQYATYVIPPFECLPRLIFPQDMNVQLLPTSRSN